MAGAKPTPAPVTLKTADVSAMSKNERIKVESKGLFYVSAKRRGAHLPRRDHRPRRGEAKTIGNEAKELSKFFGIYKQQGRGERGKQDRRLLLHGARSRCPAGGYLTPAQWRRLHRRRADAYADGTLRITSRQGIQYHHVYGPKLAPLVRT